MARLQEEARWSSFTNSWSRRVAPGAPRWVRRFIIIVFVLALFVPGLLGLVMLLTEDQSAVEGVTGCPNSAGRSEGFTSATGQLCLFSASPTVP